MGIFGILTFINWVIQIVSIFFLIISSEMKFKTRKEAKLNLMLAFIPWALVIYYLHKKIKELP